MQILIQGEIIIFKNINYKGKLLKNATIVVGQIVSIIYKTRNLWGDGGIGRRVGLRNQYFRM